MAPQTLGIDPVHRLVELAEAIDAEFVLALVDTNLDALGTLPDNVRPAGWVPLNVVLLTCVGIVHHGGAGTTMAALATGVPQLILPTGADRHINTAAVQRPGAGIGATVEELSVELLCSLINSDSMRRAAREDSAEIATLPAPVDLVPRLVELASAQVSA